MSCNCGCHDDTPRPPATGWRRFVPLIVGVIVVGALIAGALLSKNGAASRSPMERTTTAAQP